MSERISVVTIGGGTGQSILLRALMQLPFVEPTAIVTTFDSSGSSRVLKDRYGVLPYGDIQRCVLALSPYDHVRDIFSARISMSEGDQDHTGGNLLLSSLEQEFKRSETLTQARRLAVRALERMFDVRGRVIPASLHSADLRARFDRRTVAKHEVEVDEYVRRGKHLRGIYLAPHVPANEDALAAIASADLLIIGPGSWYTSVLPPMLPEGMRKAVSDRGRVLWIMSLFSEGPDMATWTGERWLREFHQYANDPERAIARSPFCILVNSTVHDVGEQYVQEGKKPISPDVFPSFFMSMRYGAIRVRKALLWQDPELARHDEGQLAIHLGRIIPRLVGD